MLYMALAHLSEITAAFMRGGLAEETPVAIVMHATSDDERVLITT